ncbi:MAG: MFS transporter [Thermodesulfobacteriota bacterium]
MPIFYGWWIVLACFIIGLYVSSIIFFGFTAFIEPIIKEFGWTYTQVSLASSLRGLEMGIFAPFLGFLVDRWGSRLLMFLGVITVGLGLILLSFTQSLFMFYLAFLFLSFGAGGCTSIVTMAVIANWFNKKAGKAFGFMASGFGASGLVIPIIVWLIEGYQWRTALVLLGLGMWAIGLPLTCIIRNKPEPYGYLPDGLPPSPEGESALQSPEINLTLKEALRERSFLYLTLAEFLRFMIVTAVVTHVMPYLGSIGLSRKTAGLVAAGIPLFSIIGRVGFGWLGDVYNKKYIMILTFFLLGTGMVAFCYVQIFWVLILFLLLFPPSFGGTMVLRVSMLREYFGRDSFGKLLGIIMGAASLGGIIGPPLAGWVFDTYKSYQYIWLTFAGSVGLAIFLVWRIQSPIPASGLRDPRP